MKKILVYCWDSVCESMTIRAMEENGYEVKLFKEPMKDYHADAAFAQKFIFYLHRTKPDMVFSYDYFPLISMICQMNQMPYAAWIYDCPQYTLLSKTISNACNFLFCFDENYTLQLQQLGAKHAVHFPLAADRKLYEECQNKGREHKDGKDIGSEGIARQDAKKDGAFLCDISFVGSLYNDEKNRLLTADFSDFTVGYIEGLMNAQAQIYGCNLVKETLQQEIGRSQNGNAAPKERNGNVAHEEQNRNAETVIAEKEMSVADVVEELVEVCGLRLGEAYTFLPVQMAADAINQEVTSRDRITAIFQLSRKLKVDLYSNSRLPECLKRQELLSERGRVDYHTEMPLVFRDSKINLNISSRTIETGVPQRVFDILACGGFCLTNYQKEIADLFEDGKDLVIYTSMEDLVKKAEYYLTHEEERAGIARNGLQKVHEFYDIKDKIKELVENIAV